MRYTKNKPSLLSSLKSWFAKKRYLKKRLVPDLLEPDIRVYWFVAASIFVSLIFYAIVFLLSENSPYCFEPLMVPDLFPSYDRLRF